MADELVVAVAVGPAKSATWCVERADGEAEGVAADLGRDLGRRLGRPVRFATYASSGKIVADASSGAWDVAFVPADAERKTQVIFGPNYFLGESTFLVADDTSIQRIEEVDRPHISVGGIADTATIRSAARYLKRASLAAISDMPTLVYRYEAGEFDAVALGRESLAGLAGTLTRKGTVLAESFHAAGSALCVPPGRPAAADELGALLEQMKADGTLRRFFDRHGLSDAPVAPAGSRP